MTKNQSNSLKGLAIIMIILFHIQYNLFGYALLTERGAGLGAWFGKISSYLATVNWAWLGLLPAVFYIGVHVFFILSGYGLTKKFYELEKFSYRSWLRQIWKVYWPYLLALPLTHVLNFVISQFLLAANRIGSVPSFFDLYTPQQYLESILVPSRWFTDRLALNFVGTWWFVGVILQFYLLLPLLILLLRKLKPQKFILMALLVTFVYRLLTAYLTDNSPIGIIGNSGQLLFINFPARFFEFALGMYLATQSSLVFFKKQALAGLGLIIAGVLSTSYIFGLAVSDILIGLGWALMFPALGKYLGRFSKPARCLEWIGARSYNFYLYQEPALKLLMVLIIGNLPL